MKLSASQIGWLTLALAVIAAGYGASKVIVAVLNKPYRQLREYTLLQIAEAKAGRDQSIVLYDADGVMLAEFVKEKEQLSGVSDLQLDVEYARGTDRFLEGIRGMPGVTGMMLAKTDVSEVGLQHITTLPDLKSLGLHKVHLSDAGLRVLQECPKLTNLSVTPHKVDLVSIPGLVATTRVKTLSLHSPFDPDWIREGAARIFEAPFIMELRLYCASMTPEELQNVRALIPQCKVRAFDEFVLDGPREIAPLPREQNPAVRAAP